jgi:TetR/AcrR family transcriptional repressor of nem operon
VTRAERAQETREALVRAAAQELAEKGIEAASLNAICDRAGYTRGAFYVHFRDRDELVAAVVERVLGNFQEILFPKDAAPDLRETIGHFVGAILSGVPEAVGTSHWKFHHTLAACAGSSRIRSKYTGIQNKALERLEAGAAAGQKRKTVRRDVEARTIAELLLVLTMGVSAATELGLEIDYAKGGAALGKLLAG